MENITLDKVNDAYTEFMAMENNLYKNIIFHKTIKHSTFHESNVCKKEGKTYYSHQMFKVKQSKDSYYRHTTKRDGFTIDEKGKVSVWFGKNIYELPGLDGFFKYLNLNWLDANLKPYITKGIFEKIVSGKITNNTDLCKAYLKAVRLNCSAKLFQQVVPNISKPNLLRHCAVAKDINHMLEYYIESINSPNYILTDMIDQAMMLRKKIDFKWSVNRLSEEHSNWTKEIMSYEGENMVDEPVPNVERWSQYDNDEIKLLKTKKEIFFEGKRMNHCLYTNYWNSIKSKNYLAFHVCHQGEQATLGVIIDGNGLKFNQCTSYRNSPITIDMKCFIQSFINSVNEKNNYSEKEQLPF